ncbi:OLC1v1013916C1 [Oldenlandia corymbosa var. corymbosa]|uniref:OLC1v1013916C1 n=1 Tax=Oldenlandia corymbosa var. corymbosa TaxID=529605 RepID=A0AAV1DZF1_OLDCO|nr:OLC1v1013916C1 [Oldenlandia corymbosa var. corymbosa]
MSSSSTSSTRIPLLIFNFLFCTSAFAINQSLHPFESIYPFGDSLSDTDNKIRQPGATSSFNVSNWPYGWKKSLIILGEIGGCDNNYALSNGWSTEEVKKHLVQFIVEAILKAVREVIQLGANFGVVPGSPPGGCLPKVLTEFPSTDPSAYDDNGCLRENNEFAMFVNDCLQRGLDSLKLEFPGHSLF